MNRNNATQYIHLLKALAENRLQEQDENGDWHDVVGECDFKMDTSQYREKPPPEEFWIVRKRVYCGVPTDAYHHKPEGYSDEELIHVKEVKPCT